MALTEDELEKKRQHNEDLRQKIASEEQKRAELVAEHQSDIHGAELDAEAARLEARLEAAKSASKVSAVKDQASGALSSAKQALSNAESAAFAPSGPVDTNAGANASAENKE